jgi:hypothetical protein
MGYATRYAQTEASGRIPMPCQPTKVAGLEGKRRAMCERLSMYSAIEILMGIVVSEMAIDRRSDLGSPG